MISQINDDQLCRFFNLHHIRWDKHYVQLDDGDWKAVHKPLTIYDCRSHIEGQITLGAPIISRDNKVECIRWDIDDIAGDGEKLYQYLTQECGLPIYRSCSRPGRYGHLECHIRPALASSIAHEFTEAAVLKAGLKLKKGNMKEGIEAFPKQATIAEGGLGSQIRTPLGINRKKEAGQVGWYEHLPAELEKQIVFQPSYNDPFAITQLLDEWQIQTKTVIKQYSESKSYSGFDIRNYITDDWKTFGEKHRGDKTIYRCPSCRSDLHDQKEEGHFFVYDSGAYGCIKGCLTVQIRQAFIELGGKQVFDRNLQLLLAPQRIDMIQEVPLGYI